MYIILNPNNFARLFCLFRVFLIGRKAFFSYFLTLKNLQNLEVKDFATSKLTSVAVEFV